MLALGYVPLQCDVMGAKACVPGMFPRVPAVFSRRRSCPHLSSHQGQEGTSYLRVPRTQGST